jgi:NAD(P)-dependent dehydrogenase (short-subunit alcohol dehydrogenase family)
VTLEDAASPGCGHPIEPADDPEDIAAMVVLLASSKARNFTGQSFNADGGLISD